MKSPKNWPEMVLKIAKSLGCAFHFKSGFISLPQMALMSSLFQVGVYNTWDVKLWSCLEFFMTTMDFGLRKIC